MNTQKDILNIVTLGCSKNVVDSEVLIRQFQGNNMNVTFDPEEANVAVINTCGFIEAAKQESIETILDAVRLKKEGKLRKVIVMGCLSERYKAELQKEIPEVDEFVGANKMNEVVRLLGGDDKHELLGERFLTTPRHFAYLKISEGCDRPCSFCSIPLMRGRHVSKPMERVLLEARRLSVLGVKELILIAQDSTYYGLDLYGKRMLAPLLDRLCEVEGIEWIRLMYAFPTGFPLDVLEQFQKNTKLCRYLDIPVQHVADSVLSSMRRGITSKQLRDLIGTIRSCVPGIALRSTLIVGYPNETEREFEQLVGFVEEMQFDRLGIFTYSHEEGTTAYPLGDPIPQGVKEERRDRIMEVQQAIAREKNERLVGETITVLIDSIDGETIVGRTQYDAPEVDNEVHVESIPNIWEGSFCEVRITDADAYDLFGVPANEAVSVEPHVWIAEQEEAKEDELQ